MEREEGKLSEPSVMEEGASRPGLLRVAGARAHARRKRRGGSERDGTQLRCSEKEKNVTHTHTHVYFFSLSAISRKSNLPPGRL